MRIKKPFIGYLLYKSGQLSLPVLLGLLLGFYFSDRGMRFLPDLVQILLGLALFALILIPLGRWMQGKAFHENHQGRKIGRRIIVSLVAITMVWAGWLGLYWITRPTPLTTLTPEDYEKVFREDLKKVREYEHSLESLTRILEDSAKVYRDVPDVIPSPQQEKDLLWAWNGIFRYAFALDQIRTFHEDWYRFDPSRSQRQFHLRSFLMMSFIELSLCDKSTRLGKVLSDFPHVVRFLDAPHPSVELPANTFDFFQKHLSRTIVLPRLEAAKRYQVWLAKGFDGEREASRLGCHFLWNHVSDYFQNLGILQTTQLAGELVKSDVQVLFRSLKRTWFPVQKEVATIMGEVRINRGTHYLISPSQLRKMDQKLEPGDILLGRKNWHLSNAGLPGFWPHAILYIGDPKKIQDYFNDSEIHTFVKNQSPGDSTLEQLLTRRFPKKWERYILGTETGPYQVIEGVAPGVVLHTLQDASGDYLAALRPRLSRLDKAQAILTAFSHLDKPYDYNFDFATNHALVCTELVWRSYRPSKTKKGLKLPLEKIMGRMTFPANQFAILYSEQVNQPDRFFDFVFFIDAREKALETFVADEKAFRESRLRSKWSMALN